MVEDKIKDNLRKIFGVQKVTYDMANETSIREQGVLFVELGGTSGRAGRNIMRTRTEGVIRIYAKNGDLPHDFFIKKIEMAPPELQKPFFFFEMDRREQVYQDIVEGSVRFRFTASRDHNPNRRKMAGITIDGVTVLSPEGES